MIGRALDRIYKNPYMIHKPDPIKDKKQLSFLLLDDEEAFYGGAAGGGKSEAILMGGLMYTQTANYSALILRQSYADLNLDDALLDRAKKWLIGRPGVRFSPSENAFHFDAIGGGVSRLQFGYLNNEQSMYRYQSAAFQYIGFDELTQFKELMYRYLFSRLRRPIDSDIPLRMRSASNPGNIGHDWVKARFIDPGDPDRPFIPARLEDNTHLDQESYKKSLNNLDPVTRARYLEGNWEVRSSGGMFQRSWFTLVKDVPADIPIAVRYWDLAATAPRPGADPDYTCGVLVGAKSGSFYIIDVQRFRARPMEVEQRIKQTAVLDSQRDCHVQTYMEQEPGSGGKNTIDHYAREILIGYHFKGDPPVTDKVSRAAPFSSAAEARNVYLVIGPWLNAYLDEIEAFPESNHKDQVDATSGAINKFRTTGPPSARLGRMM
jgi:predicted phage terminase large subunit-like protein